LRSGLLFIARIGAPLLPRERSIVRCEFFHNHFSRRKIKMLVLSRTVGEKVFIGDNITVTVVRVRGDEVRIGFDAPKEVKILRKEIEPKQAEPE
jgi:carbon storage regulator CsrA